MEVEVHQVGQFGVEIENLGKNSVVKANSRHGNGKGLLSKHIHDHRGVFCCLCALDSEPVLEFMGKVYLFD